MENVDEQLIGTWVWIDPMFGNESQFLQLTFYRDGTVAYGSYKFEYQLSDGMLTFKNGLYTVPSTLKYGINDGSTYYYSFGYISVEGGERRECLFLSTSKDSNLRLIYGKK